MCLFFKGLQQAKASFNELVKLAHLAYTVASWPHPSTMVFVKTA